MNLGCKYGSNFEILSQSKITQLCQPIRTRSVPNILSHRHNLYNWSVVKYRFLAKNRFFMLSLKSFVSVVSYVLHISKITLTTLVEFQRFGWFTEINTDLVKQKLQAFPLLSIYVSIFTLCWYKKNVGIFRSFNLNIFRVLIWIAKFQQISCIKAEGFLFPFLAIWIFSDAWPDRLKFQWLW